MLARKQFCQVMMLANDLRRIARVLDNLAGSLKRTGIDHAIRGLGQQGHEKHRARARGNKHRCHILAHGARRNRNACNGDDDGQRRGAVERHCGTAMRGNIARKRTEPHGDGDGHGTDHEQRHDKACEHQRIGGNGGEVDLSARHAKEDRNQKAVRQALELAFERMVALGDDKAQDKARGKGAKHDVEVENRRKGNKHDKDKDRKTHKRLRRGIGTILDKAEEAVAQPARAGRHGGKHHANDKKRSEDHERLNAAASREQHRHGKDRTELSPGAVCQDRIAQARAHKRALVQDGHKRAQCRRGER